MPQPLDRCNDLLKTRVFPHVVTFATHPLHIAFLLFILGPALLVGAQVIAFEQAGGNYTNVISAGVSCIVLLLSSEGAQMLAQAQTENRALRDENASLHQENLKLMHDLAQVNDEQVQHLLAIRSALGVPHIQPTTTPTTPPTEEEERPPSHAD